MTISRRAALSLIALTLLPTLACKQAAEPAAPTPETASTAAARTELAPAHRAAGDGPAALPPGHPPIDGSAGVIAAPPLGGTTTGGQLVWTVPDSWTSEPPANAMRRAQYRVPGPGGDAELVVFYFGPGEGGDPRANAERWAGQFVQPDGGDPVAALTTSTVTVGAIEILRVETSGTYQAGAMMGMGGEVTELPDYALLGAVATAPDANWFFKFTGPKATIDAERAHFDALLASLRVEG